MASILGLVIRHHPPVGLTTMRDQRPADQRTTTVVQGSVLRACNPDGLTCATFPWRPDPTGAGVRSPLRLRTWDDWPPFHHLPIIHSTGSSSTSAMAEFARAHPGGGYGDQPAQVPPPAGQRACAASPASTWRSSTLLIRGCWWARPEIKKSVPLPTSPPGAGLASLFA